MKFEFAVQDAIRTSQAKAPPTRDTFAMSICLDLVQIPEVQKSGLVTLNQGTSEVEVIERERCVLLKRPRRDIDWLVEGKYSCSTPVPEYLGKNMGTKYSCTITGSVTSGLGSAGAE